MRDLLYYGAWLFLLPMCFIATHTSLLIWIWVALVPPAEMIYGTFFPALAFNKIVAAGAMFALIVTQDRKDFYRDAIITLIALFSIQVTASYFAAQYSYPINDIQYDKFWKEIVLFVLITGVMHNRHRLHQSILVICISLGFLMVKEGLIFLLTAGGHQISGTGSLGDNNGVALALLMAIPMVLYCAKYTAEHWVRVGMYVTACLGVVTVVATYSRGGFVGLLAMGLMLLKNSKYKVRAILALAVLGVIIYASLPEDYIDRISTIRQASSDGSFEIRLLSWKINYMLALDHPFLGVGPYGSLIWENWTSELGKAVTWLFPSPLIMKTFVAHSIYFQVLGDTGFIGLFIFLALLGTALLKTVQTQRIAKRDPTLEWAGDLARATQISLVVYLVAGAALSLVYFELIYIVLAIVSRTHRTAKQLATAPDRVVEPWLRPRRAVASYPKPA